MAATPDSDAFLRNDSTRFDFNEDEVQVAPSGRGRRSSRWRCCREQTPLEKCLLILALLLALTCIVLVGFLAVLSHRGKQPRVCLSDTCVKTAAYLMKSTDRSVNPCNDFFKFACGKWNQMHIIPEDKSSYSTFEQLNDDIMVKLKVKLEEPANSADNNATLLVKRFYKSCVNLTQIETIGETPLRPILHLLGDWPVITPAWNGDNWGLEDILALIFREYNLPVIVNFEISVDDRDSDSYIIHLDQSMLGMPSHEYFQDQRERNAYLEFMIDIATLMGARPDHAREEMLEVLTFETELANLSASFEERFDAKGNYHKLSIGELQKEVPEIKWSEFISKITSVATNDSDLVVVHGMRYIKNVGKVLSETSKKVLANYITWRFLHHRVPDITEKFQEARRKYRKVMQGVSQEKARWLKCIEVTNEQLGLASGALFVKAHFDSKNKEIVREMIANIKEAFLELLHEADWMDEETREYAIAKATAIQEKIGYPDIIDDVQKLDAEFEGLHIHEDTYFINILNIEKYNAYKLIKRLGKPVDKSKWETDAAHANAYYNPNRNEIVIPAGILQPVFFTEGFSQYLSYGGIGVVIGHEISHGFDETGRQYDKDGNMREWWNNNTAQEFRNRAQCIVDQYSAYQLDDVDMYINGKNTECENIADNVGLKQAYRAYQKWEKKHGKESLLPGLDYTSDQLFFLNYAQIWCGTMRAEDVKTKIRSSTHSPGPVRVLGPLSNSVEFASAFRCPPGSRMNPTKKCHVWGN